MPLVPILPTRTSPAPACCGPRDSPQANATEDRALSRFRYTGRLPAGLRQRIRHPRRPCASSSAFNAIGSSVSDENERSRSARRRECQRFDRRRGRARTPIVASPTSSTVAGSGTLANRTLSMANGAACPMEGGPKGFSPIPKIAPSSRSRPKKASPEKVKNGKPESGLEVRIEMK